MLYSIFVFSTLIVVLFSIINPVVKSLYTSDPKPNIVVTPGNKTLLYLALSIITMITAPIMFIIWLVPSLSTKFKEHLLADLKNS